MMRLGSSLHPGRIFGGGWLDLHSSNLTCVTAAMFKGLTHAQGISLSYTKIAIIEDGAFLDMTRCKWIGLIDTKLTDLRAGMWQGLISLGRLSIESSFLTGTSRRQLVDRT